VSTIIRHHFLLTYLFTYLFITECYREIDLQVHATE